MLRNEQIIKINYQHNEDHSSVVFVDVLYADGIIERYTEYADLLEIGKRATHKKITNLDYA